MITLTERFHRLYESRSREISSAEAIMWLEHHAPTQYRQMMTWGNTLIENPANPADPPVRYFRGVRRPGLLMPGFQLTDPTTQPRNAMNTSDIYRVILDAANPNWPQRGLSIIATTSPWRANSYGHTYVVFPPDDAVIGHVGEDDLWDLHVNCISEYVTTWASSSYHYLKRAVSNAEEEPSEASDVDSIDVRDRLSKLAQNRQIIGQTGGLSGVRVPKQLTEWKKILTDTHTQIHVLANLLGVTTTLVAYIESNLRVAMDNGHSKSQLAKQIGDIVTSWACERTNGDLIDQLIPLLRYETMGCVKRLATDPSIPDDAQGEVWISAPCLMVSHTRLRSLFGAPEPTIHHNEG